jgi:hypothetical protein
MKETVSDARDRSAPGSMAADADRHQLYQDAVQDVESEIDFVTETWAQLRGFEASMLREDFCGTANTACEWVRRDPRHRAMGVDLDPEVLQWGRDNNLAALTAEQQQRVQLVQADVGEWRAELADIVLAMNFSYFLFTTRQELRNYFENVLAGLTDEGIFFLDAYGGYEAPMELEESRDCEGFEYIWEQAAFNPIDSLMTCHIHFAFPDGSRLDRAFSYHWRLWTLPEIRELLLEAGFARAVVYWEGTDEDTNEGDGIYTPATQGDADPGWVCYIVAEP